MSREETAWSLALVSHLGCCSGFLLPNWCLHLWWRLLHICPHHCQSALCKVHIWYIASLLNSLYCLPIAYRMEALTLSMDGIKGCLALSPTSHLIIWQQRAPCSPFLLLPCLPLPSLTLQDGLGVLFSASSTGNVLCCFCHCTLYFVFISISWLQHWQWT